MNRLEWTAAIVFVLACILATGCGLNERINLIEQRVETLENETCQAVPIPCTIYIDFDDYVNAIDEAILSIGPKGHFLSPDQRADYAGIIAFESLRTGLDPFLIVAIIKVESNFIYDARSPAQAIGLMQVHVPSWYKYFHMTRSDFHKALEIPRFNIYCGVTVLLIHMEGCPNSEKDSLNCYNGRKNNNPYGARVLRIRDQLKAAFGEDLP